MQPSVLRGKVTAYPAEKDRGLVEVAIGAYQQDGDTLLARAEHSMSGVYWLPEIGDVVEVEQPGLPGCEPRIVQVHRPEGDEQTEACWTQDNDVKQLLTRSGHRFTLNDNQDKPSVTLRTAGGLELHLEDEPQTVTLSMDGKDEPALLLDMKNNEVTLSAGKKLTILCGEASIAFDSSGNITVQAKGKLTLSGREVSAEAQSKLTAKGQQAELNGSMTTKISGQTKLELTSSGVTQIQGGMIKLN